MQAVITGASGHLGGALMPALLDEGTTVRVIAHHNLEAFEALDVEVVRGDVLDRRGLIAAFRGADVVYHLAAVISITGDPTGVVRRVNVEGARNAAAAALEGGVGRFIHCSSVHAFDLSTGAAVIDEASPRVPAGSPGHAAYDRSKADGERAVREIAASGLDAVVVHPTSVIGPHDAEPSRMGRFFLRLRSRRLPSLVRGGFDFVDVRDVVAGLIGAFRRGRSGQSYLLGGRHLSVGDLAAIAEEATGVRPPRTVLPIWTARLGLPFIATAARVRGVEPLYTRESLDALGLKSRIDHSLAERELGFSTRPIEETVRELYAWFGPNHD